MISYWREGKITKLWWLVAPSGGEFVTSMILLLEHSGYLLEHSGR